MKPFVFEGFRIESKSHLLAELRKLGTRFARCAFPMGFVGREQRDLAPSNWTRRLIPSASLHLSSVRIRL